MMNIQGFLKGWMRAGLVSMLMPVWFAAANPIYVAETGDDGNDGLSWGTAKRSVEAGVALAVNENDTVIISNGTYTVNSAWIQVTNAITVRSVNGPSVTFVDAANVNGRRVFNVAHAGARVEGLTMMRGNMTSWVQGGALWLSAGVVSNCVIRNSHITVAGLTLPVVSWWTAP